jgi:hypothetical protein
MNFTFVTAYLNLEDFETRPPGKSKENYLNHCKELITCGMPFVFFCENKIINDFKEIIDYKEDDRNFKLIGFDITDLKHYNDKFLNAKLPETRNLVKDTNLYMLIILQKIYWLKQVSEENPFNSRYFCWIDFGINHVLNITKKDFNHYLNKINTCAIKDNIILPSNGMPNNIEEIAHIYVDKFNESFLAGVIAGSKNSIKEFADSQYDIVNNLLNHYNKVTWEVSIWLYIYTTNTKFIKTYKSGFDIRILDNFISYN